MHQTKEVKVCICELRCWSDSVIVTPKLYIVWKTNTNTPRLSTEQTKWWDVEGVWRVSFFPDLVTFQPETAKLLSNLFCFCIVTLSNSSCFKGIMECLQQEDWWGLFPYCFLDKSNRLIFHWLPWSNKEWRVTCQHVWPVFLGGRGGEIGKSKLFVACSATTNDGHLPIRHPSCFRIVVRWCSNLHQ